MIIDILITQLRALPRLLRKYIITFPKHNNKDAQQISVKFNYFRLGGSSLRITFLLNFDPIDQRRTVDQCHVAMPIIFYIRIPYRTPP